jgi:hypothetical protein
MKIFVINKLQDFYCVYSKEINEIFNNSSFVTKNVKEANYLITCLSNETNYPIYGNPNYAKSKYQIINLNYFLKNKFNLYNFQKIIIFYHIPIVFMHNVINICYSKEDKDLKNIVICPPAIKTYKFNNNIDKKYFISFKGNISASHNRIEIINKFKKYNSNKNIIIDKTNDNYTYDDLMQNSLFGIVVEGDLPWSYRFTECINAGIIPVIIKPKNNNIFAFDELIDYSLFSIIVEDNNIDNLMNNILSNLSENEIKNMLINLEEVNNKYFISRQQQINGVLEILQKRL